MSNIHLMLVASSEAIIHNAAISVCPLESSHSIKHTGTAILNSLYVASMQINSGYASNALTFHLLILNKHSSKLLIVVNRYFNMSIYSNNKNIVTLLITHRLQTTFSISILTKSSSFLKYLLQDLNARFERSLILPLSLHKAC